MSRIATFEQFVADKPNDPFPRYALALEYKTAGRMADAETCFGELLHRLPTYVPAYLQLGMLLQSQGRADEARQVFRTGLEVAGTARDGHALSELQDALDGC